MYLKKVQLHNFRSILDGDFELDKFSVLIGENNSGKTTILDAIRIFYEDQIKYSASVDFPKIGTDDKESWIQLTYVLNEEEEATINEEYRRDDHLLVVRKLLQSEKFKEKVNSSQSNLYFVDPSGILSENLFYGAKNVSEAKLGNVLYISEISETKESFKTSGPSPFRDTLNFIFERVLKNSDQFEKLEEAFQLFNENFPKEKSKEEDCSLAQFEDELNAEIKNWGVSFKLNINPIKPQQLVKDLISPRFKDGHLDEGKEEVSVDLFGQGLQRHIIYSLLKVSSKYRKEVRESKKVFSPNFNLILFEEPEAFLHPSQQELLNNSLIILSEDDNQQIIASSHSPIFVNRNIEKLSSLVRLYKSGGKTEIFQIKDGEEEKLFSKNSEFFQFFSDMLQDDSVDNEIKSEIRAKGLGSDVPDLVQKLKSESLLYLTWIDQERASAFFARNVIICEGATEKVLLDYLLNNIWQDLKESSVYILDAMGKWNIHRYMNIFGNLGISHSVIYDQDKTSSHKTHQFVNQFLETNRGVHTVNIYGFEDDIERFLCIPKPSLSRLKPVNALSRYKEGEIDNLKIDELKRILLSCLR